MAEVKCTICGDRGHVASDCKQAAEQHQKDGFVGEVSRDFAPKQAVCVCVCCQFEMGPLTRSACANGRAWEVVRWVRLVACMAGVFLSILPMLPCVCQFDCVAASFCISCMCESTILQCFFSHHKFDILLVHPLDVHQEPHRLFKYIQGAQLGVGTKIGMSPQTRTQTTTLRSSHFWPFCLPGFGPWERAKIRSHGSKNSVGVLGSSLSLPNGAAYLRSAGATWRAPG